MNNSNITNINEYREPKQASDKESWVSKHPKLHKFTGRVAAGATAIVLLVPATREQAVDYASEALEAFTGAQPNVYELSEDRYTYRVQPNDNLRHIAELVDIAVDGEPDNMDDSSTVANIAVYNSIKDPSKISAGQLIELPFDIDSVLDQLEKDRAAALDR